MSQVVGEQELLNDVNCVKSQLVAPIVTALGWRFEDEAEVRVDYQLDGGKGNPTLALFLAGNPRVLVDVRAMGEDLPKERVLSHVVPRVGNAGFAWLLLTDGDEYSVLNASSGLRAEDRTFDSVRISDDCTREVLALLDPFQRQLIDENRIATLWRWRLVDRKVRSSLEKLIAEESALAELLLRNNENLTAADIRGSLGRADLALNFKYGDSPAETSGAGDKRKPSRPAGMSEAELRIATWLQRRAIERWAKGRAADCRNRASQRRLVTERRSNHDRRRASGDRRAVRTPASDERRTNEDRRSGERRESAERRVVCDRRRAQRRA
jgi:hypothetical protein